MARAVVAGKRKGAGWKARAPDKAVGADYFFAASRSFWIAASLVSSSWASG